MGFEIELKYKPGEQIPHADALSGLDFDDDEDNDRGCFALDNMFTMELNWDRFDSSEMSSKNKKLKLETVHGSRESFRTTERRLKYP